LSIDIREAGVAGAAPLVLLILTVDGADCTCARIAGECIVEPGLGGGPIRASDKASGEMDSLPALSPEEVFCC